MKAALRTQGEMIDLQLKSVSKRYRIQTESETPSSGLLGKLRRFSTNKDFWAVKDISFEVPRGQALGIIGHNGAGKSTLLKLLSGIATPTKGEMIINGRLSALLEVGSGFHPELTGRENTFLSGSILGMRRAEIAEKLDSIIDFAGVRQFIDIPAKRYSSGMFVRLGFSIAAHLEPEILLLDEVLAVGDLAFQEKCKKRIAELHEAGTTLVFISHDLTAVRDLCGRVILLEKGQIKADGSADDVIREYTKGAIFQKRSEVPAESRVAEITDVSFYDSEGKKTGSFLTGEPLTARVDYVVHQPTPNVSISLYFYGSDRQMAAQWTTALEGIPMDLETGTSSVEFSCAQLGLQPGVYHLDVTIEQMGTNLEFEYQSQCASIHVHATQKLRGAFYMPHTWRQVHLSDARAHHAGVEFVAEETENDPLSLSSS